MVDVHYYASLATALLIAAKLPSNERGLVEFSVVLTPEWRMVSEKIGSMRSEVFIDVTVDPSRTYDGIVIPNDADIMPAQGKPITVDEVLNVVHTRAKIQGDERGNEKAYGVVNALASAPAPGDVAERSDAQYRTCVPSGRTPVDLKPQPAAEPAEPDNTSDSDPLGGFDKMI